jgi:DNA repair exonuclease SbcCD ATPase subunit
MQRTTLSGMILGLLLLCCGGVLLASEADELREKAKAMQKKGSAIAEQGNKEQAEQLENEAVKLLEAAERMELKAKGRGEKGDRPGIDKEVHHLKERLQDLRAKEQKMREANDPKQVLAEVREQIAGTERELKQIHAHHAGHGDLPPEFRAQAEKLEIAGRRIQHLRVAAQNLKMAEEHDLAHKLMEQAEAMERDVQEAKQRLAAEMHKRQERHGDHGPDVVRELKEEIQRLRAEVKELRQKVEER